MANHYKSIVVAVDTSKEAEYAFQRGVDIAKRNEGSVLNVVNVIDTRAFKVFEARDQSVLDDAKQQSEKLLNEYKAQAEAQGVNTNIIIEYGSPKTVITNEVADSVQADLILCGATGLNAVERFLIGSISSAIVRSAKCDVLVVRMPK